MSAEPEEVEDDDDAIEIECPTCGALAIRNGDGDYAAIDTIPPHEPSLPLDVMVYMQEHPLVAELLSALVRADYDDRDLRPLLALVRRSSDLPRSAR